MGTATSNSILLCKFYTTVYVYKELTQFAVIQSVCSIVVTVDEIHDGIEATTSLTAVCLVTLDRSQKPLSM